MPPGHSQKPSLKEPVLEVVQEEDEIAGEKALNEIKIELGLDNIVTCRETRTDFWGNV